MQEELGGLNRKVVLNFLSRRIKDSKMRSRCRHIDLSQPLKLIKQQVENTEEAEHINDAIQAEVAGNNRSSVIKYLQTQVRKRQRANRKKGACKDRHKNPSANRHKNPSANRHKNPSADRHKNPSVDRHTPTVQRKQDRHKNPSADRHKRVVDISIAPAPTRPRPYYCVSRLTGGLTRR